MAFSSADSSAVSGRCFCHFFMSKALFRATLLAQKASVLEVVAVYALPAWLAVANLWGAPLN